MITFEVSFLEFFNMQRFIRNKTKLRPKMPSLRIFKLEFEKTIDIFEISNHKFDKMQSCFQNKKLQVWDKQCLVWVFLRCNFEKLLSHLKSKLWTLTKMVGFA